MEPEVEYTIKMNGKQANALVEAMELYCRMSLGQIEYLAEMLTKNHKKLQPSDSTGYRNVQDELRADLDAFKAKFLGFPPNASFGIGHPETSQSSRIVYSIECVLRNQIAKAEDHGKHSVWHNDSPINYSDETMPTASHLAFSSLDWDGKTNKEVYEECKGVTSSAYWNGFCAFVDGKSIDENPYRARADEWEKGYRDAQKRAKAGF